MDSVRDALQMHPALWWLREACAVALWVYVLVNAFVVSIDDAILSAAPALDTVLPFKGLAFLGVAAVAWLALGNKRFGSTVGYVVGYPFVVLLWKVPKWAFSNWSLVLAFLPAFYALSKAFRRTFVMAVLALASAAVVLHADLDWAVGLAGGYLLLYLAVHYVRRFVGSFSRSTVFSAALRGVKGLRDQIDRTGFLANRVDAKGQERDSLGRVSGGYFVLSAMRIAAERLREVSESRRVDLYLISSLAFSVALTTVVFALAYVAVARVDPGAFTVPGGGMGFWRSVGYSFSTLMTSDLMGVQPVSALARALSLAEVLCAVLLLILLAFVVLTSIRERYRADLDKIVLELREAAEVAGRSLEQEFNMTVREIEAALAESDPALMELLEKLDPEVQLLTAGPVPQSPRSPTSPPAGSSELREPVPPTLDDIPPAPPL